MSAATGERTPDPWVMSRDRRVLTHVAAVTVSDIGDQIWLVALTFTAAQLLAPRPPRWSSVRRSSPGP